MVTKILADRIATVVFYLVASATLLLFLGFIGYLLWKGGATLSIHFLTSPPKFMQSGGGIGLALFNSLYMLLLSLIFTFPIGLAAGIYMAEYAKPNKITAAIRFCIDTLTSIPSVIIGLFGLLVFVKMTGWGFSLASGALSLAVLNLPVTARLSEDAIRSVPRNLKEAALALGSTRWQALTSIVLSAAVPGLITGLILTSGRVFGEAAALIYTSGMSGPPLDFSNWNPFSHLSPLNPFRPGETLAVYIWKINSEGLVPDARQIADGASVVLVLLILIFNVAARLVSRIWRKY